MCKKQTAVSLSSTEWQVHPADTATLVRRNTEFVAHAESNPSQGTFPDMFNDIELHRNGTEERCIHNTREVFEFLH